MRGSTPDLFVLIPLHPGLLSQTLHPFPVGEKDVAGGQEECQVLQGSHKLGEDQRLDLQPLVTGTLNELSAEVGTEATLLEAKWEAGVWSFSKSGNKG